jgi:hypothetical protein
MRRQCDGNAMYGGRAACGGSAACAEIVVRRKIFRRICVAFLSRFVAFASYFCNDFIALRRVIRIESLVYRLSDRRRPGLLGGRLGGAGRGEPAAGASFWRAGRPGGQVR